MRSMRRSIPQTYAGFEDREGFLSRTMTKLNSLCMAATYPFAGCRAPRIRLGNRVEVGKHAGLILREISEIRGPRWT